METQTVIANERNLGIRQTSRDLGNQYAKAWRAYAENRPAYEAACEAHAMKFVAAVRKNLAPVSINGNISPAASKLYDETEQEVTKLRGPGSVEEQDTRTHEAVCRLREKIWSKRPTGIADLANLANIAASIHSEAWENEPEKLDYDQMAIRYLIDGVLRVAGQKLVIEGLPFPQVVASCWAEASDALESIGVPVSVRTARCR